MPEAGMTSDPPPERETQFHCSFCGKSPPKVKKLIYGRDVRICDQCIELANEILAEETDA